MRILSWNMQWGRGADGVVDIGRTVEAIRAAGALDIICLQEVARNWPGLKGLDSPEDTPRRLAEAFPGYLPIFAAGVEHGDAHAGTRAFGNLMLVRGRAGQIFRRLLPLPADPGVRGMQRVCLEVCLAGPGAPLRVLTTHLEYYSERQRRAQVEALRANQAEVAVDPGTPPPTRVDSLFGLPPRPAAAVLCGDLNFAPGSPEHRRLCAPSSDGRVLWIDAWPLANGDRPHAHSVGLHGAEWPERPYCCDYFFVTPELRGRVRRLEVLSETPASDHQPLLLELDAD